MPQSRLINDKIYASLDVAMYKILRLHKIKQLNNINWFQNFYINAKWFFLMQYQSYSKFTLTSVHVVKIWFNFIQNFETVVSLRSLVRAEWFRPFSIYYINIINDQGLPVVIDLSKPQIIANVVFYGIIEIIVISPINRAVLINAFYKNLCSEGIFSQFSLSHFISVISLSYVKF